MASKNSKPDAQVRAVPTLGQALNGKGGNTSIPAVKGLHEELNGGGRKSKGGKLGFSGTHSDFNKMDVQISSVGAQKSKVAKQERANDKAVSKRRGAKS